jgi:hypothetical protein
VPRPSPATSAARLKPDPVPPGTSRIADRNSASPEAIAACAANPEAMVALQSGDPVGFARAMGIEHPCEAFLTAANTKGSPFDPGSSASWATSTNARAPKA